MYRERVGSPCNIKVSLVADDVIVHGAAEGIVNLVSVIIVVGKECGLDVARCFDRDLYATIRAKVVGEGIIIISYS